MPRPKSGNDHAITTYVSAADQAKLEELVFRTGMSRAALVRGFIHDSIDVMLARAPVREIHQPVGREVVDAELTRRWVEQEIVGLEEGWLS